MQFGNRADAGRELAVRLTGLRGRDPVVLGLPRGGVVVGYEIAAALAAPLDVLLVRKLAVPSRPELAIGALGEGGVVVANEDVLRQKELTRNDLDAAIARETPELLRRVARYRQVRPPVDVAGRMVVLTDDGIATGATVRAAVRVLRARRVGSIVLTVPVAPRKTLTELARTVEYVVCPVPPTWMRSVGSWYLDFGQVPEDRVLGLLRESTEPVAVR